VRLTGIFASLGVKKIRYTGGEPLLRKGFIDIVAKTRERFPLLELCLTTNGTLLREHLPSLAKHGMKKINISLDTLSRERYQAISGADCLANVLDAIDAAMGMGSFEIKINAVLFRETIKELDDLLEYVKDRDATLRFIERMPFTDEDETQSFLPCEGLLDALSQRGSLKRNLNTDTNVALMYDFLYREKHRIRIGIIPPISKKFCAACNRLRLTAAGFLKTCLYSSQDLDLKKQLREGKDDEFIAQSIITEVGKKHESHGLDCEHYEKGCSSISAQSMSKIGG